MGTDAQGIAVLVITVATIAQFMCRYIPCGSKMRSAVSAVVQLLCERFCLVDVGPTGTSV